MYQIIHTYISYERRKSRINYQDSTDTTHPQSHDCPKGHLDGCDHHIYQGFDENHQF